MRLLLLAAALAAPMCAPAQAAMFCSEPSSPYCADSYGAFSDEYAFRSCRSDMESYANEVNDYVECLGRASDEAIDEYNNAVESFNDRANS